MPRPMSSRLAPHPFRFGVQARPRADRAEWVETRSAGRGERVRRADDARPLHRPARTRAGADGRRSTPRRPCGSARWCGTTTTSTRSCWPRSWPRSTCCRTVGSRSASAPGWMIDGLRPVRHPVRPRRRPHRPLRRRPRGHQGRDWPTGPFSLSRRALHDHRTTTGCPSRCRLRARRSSSAAVASACCRSPPARPTSSASTARCTPA